MLESLKIIESDGRVSLNLFQEWWYICLIFKRKLHLLGTNDVDIEIELEFDILNIVFVLIVRDAHILGIFPIFDNKATAVNTISDTFRLKSPLYFG